MTMNMHLPLAQRAGAISIVSVLCGSPICTNAAAAPPPIEIRACSPVFAAIENSPYAMGVQFQSGIEIRFVNHARVAAQQVVFSLGDTPGAETFVDRGTFSPGATIRAVFETARAESVCRVAQTRFADQTVYDATLPTVVGASAALPRK